jgi:ankyrin repeat protein
MEGQDTVVRMLVVEQQARMDVRNWEGWVPMIWAIVRGHVDIVKFLAERVRPAPDGRLNAAVPTAIPTLSVHATRRGPACNGRRT